MQRKTAQLKKTTMKTLTRITKKKWSTLIADFLHIHDLFHIEIGKKQHKKTTREIEGSGVKFNPNGNVASCEKDFHIKEETEEY